MSTKKVEIALPAFSGPLDLLLHLIERDALDITALSLAEITGQYLEQVEALEEQQVAGLIDFIVVGARLMVIKSRALLPTPPIVLAGEEEEEDPAETLVRQLRLYKQFKQSADWMQNREQQGLRTYLRLAPPPKVDIKLDLGNLSPNRLQLLTNAALQRLAEREASVSVAAPRKLTIEGQMEKLSRRLRRHSQFAFDALLSRRASSNELSVTLLAVLEAIKRHQISVDQPIPFGPIAIRRHPNGANGNGH